MAFGELYKIIFVKISDEQAKRKKSEPYQFQIKTHESSRRLAERIRALYAEQQAKDPEVFTETIKIDDATLRTIVSHLESINLSKTDLDTKGLAFEQFMDGFFKGDFGQYFTPREIIEFAVQMMQPSSDDLVLTNPPFGAMVKQEEKPYLSSYEMAEISHTVKTLAKVDPGMGKKAIKKKTSVKTEILFLEQVWRFLKPGTGRAAIVLPDGILTNSSLQGVRDWLLVKFQRINQNIGMVTFLGPALKIL